MKIKLLFNTAVITLSLMMCSNSMAQSSSWKLLNSDDGIEIYSQRVSCDVQGASVPFDYVVFKAVNTTSTESTFNLKFEIYFQEGCNGCGGSGETSTTMTLGPNESKEGSCSDLENRLSYFILNPSFNESWTYTHSKALIQPIK